VRPPVVRTVTADGMTCPTPHVGVSTGPAACCLGLVSMAWPRAAGGYLPAWSVLAMAWGASITVVALASSGGRVRVALA